MLSSSYIREAIDYDPDIGLCLWKERPVSHFKNWKERRDWNSKNAGKLVKPVYWAGYRIIFLGDQEYYLHRIIYTYMTGEQPIYIQHRDGNIRNNIWSNIKHYSKQPILDEIRSLR